MIMNRYERQRNAAAWKSPDSMKVALVPSLHCDI
jgi:hypothetical protein